MAGARQVFGGLTLLLACGRFCPCTGFYLAAHHMLLRRCKDPPLYMLQLAPESGANAETIGIAFGTALSQAWGGDPSGLRQLMHPNARVITPMWKCSSRSEFVLEIARATKFFGSLSSPTLMLLSNKRLDGGRVQVLWRLGLEWPALWRPKIGILGNSVLTMHQDGSSSSVDAEEPRPLVIGVEETWHQRPRDVFFFQVLPKFRDISSLWASPTAEHLPIHTMSSSSDYDIVRLPPLLALQAEWIESGGMLRAEQAPLPPWYAFTGEVKRSEWYATVSPGIIERSLISQDLSAGYVQMAQRRRWICPLPLRFGDDPSAMPDPDGGCDELDQLPASVASPSVQYVRRPSQLLAIWNVKQVPSNQVVLETALRLTEKVEADGWRVARSVGRPVVMQLSGDLKYGFNTKRQLSMCVWLSVPDFLRTEWVGVVLDEN